MSSSRNLVSRKRIKGRVSYKRWEFSGVDIVTGVGEGVRDEKI